jgi:hypothetical protein
MRGVVASRIMPRTTIDLDAEVLRELKARRRREGKTLGQVASELLARALAEGEEPVEEPFEWATQPMGARIDLADKEAVYRALQRDE